jgi:hypothetical protein
MLSTATQSHAIILTAKNTCHDVFKTGCTWDDDSKLLDLFTFETYHGRGFSPDLPDGSPVAGVTGVGGGFQPFQPFQPAWPPWPNRTTEHEHPAIPTSRHVTMWHVRMQENLKPGAFGDAE